MPLTRSCVRALSLRLLSSLAVILLLCAPASAQVAHWGISASFEPSWTAKIDALKILYAADGIDMSGKDFRFGLVRGREQRGEWGISFVQKTFDSKSTLTDGTTLYLMADKVALKGVEFHGTPVVGRIGERFQLGLTVGGGIAAIRGNTLRNDGVQVAADDVLQPFGFDLKMHPLFRFQLAGSYLAAPGLKLRVSGGFDWPGTAKIAIGCVYLFGY